MALGSVQETLLAVSKPHVSLSPAMSSLDGPWTPWSPSLRLLFLGTILPAAIVLFTLFYDLVCFIPWPTPVKALWNVLKSPFRDFLTIDDLETELGPTQTPPTWKARVLVVFSALETAVWAAFLAYELFAGDETKFVLGRAAVSVAAWVCGVLWVSGAAR